MDRLRNARYELERGMSNLFHNFKSRTGLASGSEFLNSNTLVAKVTFLILVVLAFIFLLRLGTMLLTYLFSPTDSPKIINGMKANTKEQLKISQNPGLSGSIPIRRSSNERDGIEFTWSVWIYIAGLQYKTGTRRHIFSKGSDRVDPDNNMMTPNNAPGLYIHPTKNALVVVMNTFNSINEEVIINDIPLNKWINVMIRMEGNIMDVYVNGTIAVRHKLSGVPKQNYGDVLVTANGGFDGNLSDLWYFDYALNTSEIMEIVADGPNLTVTPAQTIALPHYFSLRWYFENATDKQ